MSERATPAAALPPLSPLSRRIQQHATHMGIARMLGVAGSRPIELTLLDIQIEAPVRLREENLPTPRGGETRPMERPRETEEQMGVCTPQFFLRNTARTTREENRLEFQRVEMVSPPPDARALLREAALREPPPALVRDEIHSYLAQRAALMLEPWNTRYGRPDPG